MNNRAVTTGGIVVIILGFLVILLIVTGPLRVGYDYAKEKFFGEHSIFSSLAPSREKEFQPYTGAMVKITPEEKIVDYSVKALICAVNSLALGRPGWLSQNICPEGFTNESSSCTGAAYGQSCVECETIEEGMRLITLSEYDSAARAQLVDETIDCWKNFESGSWKNVYCAKAVIPVTEIDSFWSIKETDFREQLNNQPGIGDDIAGRWWEFVELGGKKYKWLLPDPLLVNIAPVYVCGRTRIAHGSDSAHNIILTSNLADCEVTETPPEKEFRCSVKDFELPQELGSSILPADLAQDIIKRYTDPKYLVYYEEFPVAEAAAWQINPGSFIIDVVLVGAGFNAIPVVGHYGKGLLAAGKGFLRTTRRFITQSFRRALGRESRNLAGAKTTPEMYETLFRRIGSQDLATEFGEVALREVLQGANAKGYEILLRSERLYVDVFDSLRGRIPGLAGPAGVKAAEELSEKVREIVLKKYRLWPESYGRMPASEIDALVNSISDDVLKEVDVLVFPSVLRDSERAAVRNAIDRFVANPLTSAELLALTKQQAVKQFFAKYMIKESGEGLSEEGLKEVFAQAFSKELFDSLDDVAAREVSERAAGHADAIIDAAKDGDEMWRASVIGTTSVRPDLEKVVTAIGDANSQNIQNFFTGMNGQNIQRFLIGTSFKDFPEFTAALKAAPARYNPLYLTWEGATWLIPGDMVLWSIMKSTGGTLLYKLPVAGGTLAYDVAWRPRIARYALAYIIGSAIAKADASNEKYRRKGGDSVVLQKPYLYDKNRVYSLSTDTSDFFFGLFKFDNGKKGLSRFFMVSPCKADLIVSRIKCACDYGNGAYLLHSSDQPIYPTLQPITPSSITLKSADALVNRRLFDEETEDVQNQLVSWCAEWGNVDSFSSKCGNTMATNPDAYNKFLKYTYNKVYVPAVQFLTNHGDETFPRKTLYELLDEKIHKLRDYTRGSVAQGLADFAAMTSPNIESIYEQAREFPGFYVASGMGDDTSVVPHVLAPMLVESGPLEPLPDDVVVFRKTPLSFDEFKIQFESSVFSSWASNPIPEIYMTMVEMNKKYPRTFTDLFNKDQFFWAAANNTLLNYYIVKDDRVDKTNVVKQCDMSSMSAPAISDVMIDFDAGRSVVNCFSAQASLESDYNHGNNYCFTGDISYITNAKWIATGLAVAFDIGVAVGTGGTSALITPVATGFLSAWAGHELDKQQWWPNH